MGVRERGRAGGILGLLSTLRAHRGAIEYDLLRLGLRLDDLPGPELSWHDLLVICQHSGPDTALWRSVNPQWVQTPETDFLRAIEFGIRQIAWLNSRDGQKGRDAPKPFMWPWEVEAERTRGAIKGDAVTIEEANRRLGWTKEMIDARRMPKGSGVPDDVTGAAVPEDEHRAFPDDEE